jgi:hypothetical protein
MADVAIQTMAEPEQSAAPVRWPLTRRLVFRFFFCYWILYALPEGGRVSLIPAGEAIFKPYTKLVHTVAPWVAVHVFHVSGQPATYFPTGSGDTTLQYITNLLYVVVALFATAVWSVLDRKRPHYRTFDAWLRVIVRYNLAVTLFGYGLVKIVPLQFQPTLLFKLVEPFGEFSPMGVLWSFMGASLPYVVFSGCAETLGGALLLFRRTTSLGAMVSFAVMLNVCVLNYCYDTPVKLYSTNIALMALFLLAPDARRLFDVLVRNRAAAPADLNPIRFERRWLRIASVACWIAFVGVQLGGGAFAARQGYQRTYRHPVKVPHYGLYEVESGAPGNWRKVTIEFPNRIGVRTADDQALFVTTGKVSWSEPDANHLVGQGVFNGTPATLRLRRLDLQQFRLLNRGFHWINEYPFNR